MGWLVKVGAWFKGLNKEDYKRLGTTLLILTLTIAYWHSNVKHDQTKEKLRLSSEALKSAQSTIKRQMAEQVINEKLRTDLRERLEQRDVELAKTKEELSEELESIKDEYADLLATQAVTDLPVVSEEQELTNNDGACYAQVESISRRAAIAVNDRLWSFYRDQVQDGAGGP